MCEGRRARGYLAIFQQNFADLRWLDIMAVAVVLIGVLLVSHVPYARFPKIGQWSYLLTMAPRGFYWFQLVEDTDA